MYSPGIRVGEYSILYYYFDKGLVVKVFRDGATEHHTYTLVKPGNIFKLINNKWILLDTISLPPLKEYKDFIEKASYDLSLVITLYPVNYQGNMDKMELSKLEKDFVASLTYDYFMNNSLDWLPKEETKEVNIYTIYDEDTILFLPGTKDEKELILKGPDIRQNMKYALTGSPIILSPVQTTTSENVNLETYQIQESPKPISK